MADNIDLFLKATLFNNALYEVEQSPVERVVPFDDGHATVSDPIEDFLQKAALNVGQTAHVWQEPITPPAAEPLEKSVVSCSERTEQRIRKVLDSFDSVAKLFDGNHYEERREAERLVREAFADVRNQVAA